MSAHRISVCILAGAAAAALGTMPLAAQYAPVPDTYSVTQVNSMMGPSVITRVWRDGTKARVDYTTAAAQPGGKATHIRTIYDMTAHTNTTWDPTAQAPECGTGTWGGDWGDPFTGSIELNKDIVQKHLQPVGTEMVNNVSTSVFNDDMGADGKAKVWVEPKYGLIMRAQFGPAPPLPTVLETQVLSFTKPPAGTFDIPAACKAAAALPSPEEKQIADETGEPASNFVKAISGPSTPQSCTVLLRMVQLKSMATVPGGYQIGIDRDVDEQHPADYAFGPDAHGKMIVSGGHLTEVTNQVKNGVLRIENAPPLFHVEIRVPNGGGMTGIYRKCTGPVTTLLYMVTSLDHLTPGDWLWVKSGKQAGH
jgi:hypothetical protein